MLCRMTWVSLVDDARVSDEPVIGWGYGIEVNASPFEELIGYMPWANLASYLSLKKLDVTMERLATDLAVAHAAAVKADRLGGV